MKKFLVLTGLFFSTTLGAQAQTDLYLIPDGAWVGAHFFSEKRVSIDVKLESNAPLDLIRAELAPRVKLVSNDYGFWYLGGGLSFIPSKLGSESDDQVNGIIADLGFRLRPLKQYPNFKVLMEISPLFDVEGKGSPVLRSRFGVAWTLRKKNK